MKKPRVRTWIGALAMIVLSALAVQSAWAEGQIADAPRPKNKKPWFQWLAGGAFVVAIIIPVFKNPKRSHL